MSSLFHGRKRESAALFLVSTHQLSLSVFEYLPDGRARVFFRGSSPLPTHSHFAKDRFDSLVGSLAHQLLGAFESSMRKIGYASRPRQVSAFFAPPIAAFSTDTFLIVSRTSPLKLTTGMLEEKIAETEERFLANVRERAKEKGVFKTRPGTYEVIERTISDTLIDGYPVSHYRSRNFHTFSARLSSIAVPSELLSKLGDACHSVFRHLDISHRGVLSAVLPELALPGGRAGRLLAGLILEDCSVVAYRGEKLPIAEVLLSKGSTTLAAELSETLSLTKALTYSYAQLLQEEKLSGDEASRFLKAIEEVVGKWLANLLLVRQDMSESFTLPKPLLLIPSDAFTEVLFSRVRAKLEDSYGVHELHTLLPKDVEGVEVSEGVVLSTLERLLVRAVSNSAQA